MARGDPLRPAPAVHRLSGPLLGSATDQVFATTSNLVVSVVITRAGGLEALGRFQLAFTTYLIALGFLRQLVLEPLLVSSERGDRSAATTATLLYGGAWAVLGVPVAAIIGGPWLAAAALLLPLVLLQDAGRYMAFRASEEHHAIALDGLWAAVSLAAAPVVFAMPARTGAVAWATGGALGGVWVLRRTPPSRVGTAIRWWREHAAALGGSLAVAGGLYTFGTQGVLLVVAGASGLTELGALRAVLILFGPVPLGLTAVGMVVVPRLARGQPTRRQQLIFGMAVTAGAALASAAIAIARPVLLPLLYGDEVELSATLVSALAVYTILTSAGWAALTLLRAARDGRGIVRAHVIGYLFGSLPALAVAGTGDPELISLALVAQSLILVGAGWTVLLGHQARSTLAT